MKVREVVERLGLEVKAGAGGLEETVHGGYASDLLSDVLANAEEGALWVTLQTHQNIVAVAATKGLAAIVLVNGRSPEPETASKAEDEGLPLLSTKLSTFALIGKLHELGLG